MRIISDITGKEYKTVEECEKAEEEFYAEKAKREAEAKQKAENRKLREQELNDAYDEYIETKQHYNKLMREFLNDYGSVHLNRSFRNTIPTELISQFFNNKDW